MKIYNQNDSKVPAPDTSAVARRDVVSSYIFATSNRSLSKYGERLLMSVIEVAKEYAIDAAFGEHKLNFAEKYKEKFATVDIPVRNLLDLDDTSNYTAAKHAAVELMKIYHTVESPVLDSEGNPVTYGDGTPQYKFMSYHLLDKVTINEKPGIVSVRLGQDTWTQILDMGKGYTRYDLLAARRLNDPTAIRLFQIMSNSSRPVEFSLDRIKGILGMSDKYAKNPTLFLKRVIEPAEVEIKEKCSFEVVHELTYERKVEKGRPSVKGLIFSKVMKPSVITQTDLELPERLKEVLKGVGFDQNGLRNNRKLFLDVMKAGHDIYAFLEQIEPYAKKATTPPAYVVNSLKNLLAGNKPSGFMKTSSQPAQGAVRKLEIATPKVKDKKESQKERLKVKGSDAFGTDSGLEEL